MRAPRYRSPSKGVVVKNSSMHTATCNFTITAARTSDIPDVRQLFLAYADSLDVDLCFQDFETELATLPGKYAPPDGELLLARDGQEKPIGCVAMRKLTESVCEMKRLYVSPAARSTGLGRALTHAIISAAQTSGYREMWLDSLPTMHEAVVLYRKSGFSDIAPYYDTPVRGTVFLGKILQCT